MEHWSRTTGTTLYSLTFTSELKGVAAVRGGGGGELSDPAVTLIKFSSGFKIFKL